MMGGEVALSFSAASVVEEVLQHHGIRARDLDLDSRRAEEAGARRNEAARWLRKTVGVVAGKDLPAEPSEEEFRLGLRSGILLCNAINKIQPGAVPKVVESPCDAALIPDGAALSAFQYFENVRNFLVAVQELALPSFEASDLEQGGKSARVVNCVLALKSYSEWKQAGGNGTWKFGGNVKAVVSGKSFVRKNSEPFTNSFSRTSSNNERLFNNVTNDVECNKMSNGSLGMLVRAVLLDKKPDEIPTLVESVLSKVAEEFEHRILNQSDMAKTSSKDMGVSQSSKFFSRSQSVDNRSEDKSFKKINQDKIHQKKNVSDEEFRNKVMKQRVIFDEQQKDIEDLKHTLNTTKAGMQFMQMKFHEEFNNLGMHIHGLAQAASGYHKVLEENRKLYNLVQDLKGNIRVYCRVKPFSPGQSNYLSNVDHIEDGTITINTPSRHGTGLKSFNFNKVFGPSATQAEVFADMQPLIRSVLDGYNVCIFAYGQTGSGKTYTMSGPKDLTEKNQGVNYMALGDLFYLAKQRKDIFRYSVAVQMIEIYNEQVRDLLATDGSNKRLEICNSSQTGLSVPDANLVPVSSTCDVIDLMSLGQRNRAVGATALNDRSSRSHSCLTVHVQGKDLTSGAVLRGCLHLVDLAGSERVDKSEVTGDRLKETQHINKSLSALGDVIASLAQKNSHVPYRNSKLTQLLQDSLGGQAKTLMFVHISPEADAVSETISTLKFAERVATVELGAAKVNKDNADAKELKEQIASLKSALVRKGGDAECLQFSVYDNYSGKDSELSPLDCKQPIAENRNKIRQPMEDVGNTETSPALRKKRESFDLDELQANSPPWPPVVIPCKSSRDDEKEMASAEWVDKVMVNKQDGMKRAENSPACWEPESRILHDAILQKYLSDSSNVCPDQSFGMFTGANRFNLCGTDDMDDAGTSDSSEADLLWQFNQSKFSSMANGIDSQTTKPKSKVPRSSHLRNLSPMQGPSQPRKVANGVGNPLHRTGRQPVSADGKRKTGNKR